MEVVKYKYKFTEEERTELKKICEVIKSPDESTSMFGKQMLLTSKAFDKIYNNKIKVWRYWEFLKYPRIDDLTTYGTTIRELLQPEFEQRQKYYEPNAFMLVRFITNILDDIETFYYIKN